MSTEEQAASITEVEARDRRRAKILASKDARMARITGAHKNDPSSSSESLKVDEIVLQEYIAEGRKQAVELAIQDYSKTHKEHESEPDELLTGEEIKIKQKEGLKLKLESNEISYTGKLDSFLASLVVMVSAVAAAFFLLKRSGDELKFCFNPTGIVFTRISECRAGLLPVFLQIVPTAFAMALLPLISDLLKGRKPIASIVISAFQRALLFLVIFLFFIRILQ